MLKQHDASIHAAEATGDARTGFEDHATEVIGHLRSALAAVLSSTSTVAARKGVGEILKPTDLQKALGLDAALAWSIYRAVHSDDPFRAATFIPGSVALARFLKAAQNFGVSKDNTERATAAFQVFENMIEVQGGDRASFLSMASDYDAELSSAADLKQRRAAFRANSHIHGIQARTIFSNTIVRPNAEGRLDAISIRGQIGIRQLRRNPVLATEFKWATAVTANGTTVPIVDSPLPSEPLDPPVPGDEGPEAALQRMGLMRKYCSEPLPNFRTFESNGFLCAQLVSPGLGNAKACDVVVGQFVRGFTTSPLGIEMASYFSTGLTRPAALFYRDVIVHWDAWKGPAPTVECFASNASDGLTFNEFSRLALYDEVVELGRGRNAIDIPEVPRYPEMVAEAFERSGWDPSEFRIFRFRWEYPVLQSMVRMMFTRQLESPAATPA